MRGSKDVLVICALTVTFVMGSAACKKDKEDDESDTESTTTVVGGGGGSDDGSVDAAPTPGAGPTFSNITKSGLTVSWEAATDDTTDAADLEYQLVSATSKTDLSTVTLATAVTGDDIRQAWTKASLSATVSDLAFSQTLAFAVLVRDSDGNVALYPPEVATTLDPNAPTPGTGISFSMVDYTSFSISWGAATSLATAEADLKYRVVIAESSADIDTIAEAAALTGSNVVMDWTKNQLAAAAVGLHFGRTYHVAVMVKDQEDRTALYTSASQETTHFKLIFVTDWTYAATVLGAFADADGACEARKPSDKSGSTFKALYAGGGRTACTNAYCNPLVGGDLNDWPMEPTTSYESIAGELIWTTGTRPIVESGATVGQISTGSDQTWTGLAADWTETADNCSNWTSVSSGFDGMGGWGSNTSPAVWSGYNWRCDIPRQLYCVEQ